MPTPNGEVALVVMSKPYNVKPSFRFLTRVEEATDKSILEIAQGMSNGRVRIGHLAQILYVAVQEAGGDETVNDIGNWIIQEDKTIEVSKSVAELIMGALTARPKT